MKRQVGEFMTEKELATLLEAFIDEHGDALGSANIIGCDGTFGDHEVANGKAGIVVWAGGSRFKLTITRTQF